MRLIPPDQPLSCNAPFQTVLHESYAQAGRQFRVIEDQGAWCAFWDEFHGQSTEAPPCDTSLVDFSREVAVIAVMGERATGCYDIAVTCIHRDEATSNLRIDVAETAPGTWCVCMQALTDPLIVVKVSRPVGSATFNSSRVTLDCRSTACLRAGGAAGPRPG